MKKWGKDGKIGTPRKKVIGDVLTVMELDTFQHSLVKSQKDVQSAMAGDIYRE